MLCERCKAREATIQYTEVVNGVRTEHNFCAQCASEMDLGQDFPLGRLLSGLLGLGAGNPREENYSQVVCPTCGTSYEEFVKTSRYEVFDLLISDKIKQLQGSDCHRGKKAKNAQTPEAEETAQSISGEEDRTASVEEQIARLYACQQAAVKREDYDEAARCRDEIRKLKMGSETDA